MGQLSVKTTTKTTTETVLAIAGTELVEVLQNTIEKLGHSIEDISGIYIRVPGGGDWSNTNLDIDKDCPLIIKLRKETNNEQCGAENIRYTKYS